MLQTEIHDHIGIITMSSPPVNALGLALRSALFEQLEAWCNNDNIQAIVIESGLGLFCGGADIEEFKTTKLWHKPDLHDVINFIEASEKLVIAAVNGVAMGGAVELALGCDYRIASPHARLGLPEIHLGLFPGGGGTQRLPRVTDLPTTVDMVLGGRPITGKDAFECGLVDHLSDDGVDFRSSVMQYTTDLITRNAPRRSCIEMAVDRSGIKDDFFDEIRASIASKTRGQVAPEQCLQSIEAACELSLPIGLDQDKLRFQALLETPQSRAQRHLFFAQREAQKVPGIDGAEKARHIGQVGIIGAGTMGQGIAITFADAGIPVVLLEVNETSLDKGLTAIRGHYQRAAAKARITDQVANHRINAIKGSVSYADLADVDLVIEAVFEEIEIKKQVFQALDKVCKPGAILASNTSTLDLNKIATYTQRPQDVVGLHFFSPANIMRLLEIVRGDKTAPDVIKTALALSRKINKVPVVVGVCFGFVGNRMLEPYYRESSRLLLEGATPEQIDTVLTDFGMAMGIVSMADLAGIDVSARIRVGRRQQLAHDPSYQAIQDKLYSLGRYGQKTGRGSYLYEGREKRNDPEVISLCQQLALDLGVERRKISNEEILERCLYPLINEGIQLLDEGIAYRSGDCDVIWANGYGFPDWRGGPLHYAEEVGLDSVLVAMRKYRKQLGNYGEMWFQPAPLLERLVNQRQSLSSIAPAP